MSEVRLRKAHKLTFRESKFDIKIPRWMHRNILERRLFYYFCVKNYHYPKSHPIAVEFRKRAKHVLSKEYLVELDPVEQAKQMTKEAANFTITNVKAMPIVEVDRYLASLSLYVEADEQTRRKVLWEWFNRPSRDLPQHFNEQGKKVAARRKGNLNNKYRLRDLILRNSRLAYDDFMLAFGQQMPTVTRASFNNARSLLKKIGYDIPSLPKGPSKPVVVAGPYGHPKRGRILDDTTIVEVDNGEEEPF